VRALILLLAAVTAPALAGDEDAAALLLADQTAATAEQSKDWRVFVEAAARESRPQGPGQARHGTRLSLDARFDKAFAPGWRAVFADRLDLNRMDGVSGNGDINTLKEVYASWQAQPDRIADLGRINARHGVAMGYNPTDTFRAGALRSVVSLDPASLRENRLGSAMLRGQTLWTGGSLTALYSPKLADKPSDSAFSPDWGATNQRARWLVALSDKLSAALNPQWLLYGGAGQSPQLGLNMTALPNDATVAYVEWSGGRAASLAAQALKSPDDAAFRSRLSTGLTYTTPNNISLTAEYQYNGAGLDRAGWDTLRRGPPAAYGQYRGFVTNIQDPPTRDHVFLYALWQDALVKRLDLTAMVRYDAVDHSRLQWLEARYHWSRVDIALQTQLNTGQPGSNYGAAPERRMWQALLRYFF
jgi:opacity protein-like surface antigen